MNRRHMIRGLIASTAGASFLPASALPVSIEARQREALRLLISMPWKHGFNVHLVHIAFTERSRLHDYAVELFDSGLSIDEMRARLDERVRQLDG